MIHVDVYSLQNKKGEGRGKDMSREYCDLLFICNRTKKGKAEGKLFEFIRSRINKGKGQGKECHSVRFRSECLFFFWNRMEQVDLCLAIDEELAAFLRCVDNYETSSREVRYPQSNPVLKKLLTLKNS